MGISSANKMTTTQRFGPMVGDTVIIISLGFAVPFVWFALSGGALQLHRAFCGCTVFFGLHSLLLASFLNAGQDSKTSLTVSLAIGIIGAILGYRMPTRVWPLVVLWASIIVVVLFRVILGPLAYIGLIPGPRIWTFYLVVLILGLLISLAIQNTVYKNPDHMQICNAALIGFVCALPVTSGISELLELSGKPANYGYLKFLSVPGTISMTNGIDILLTLTLFSITGMGGWLNYIRYKQFGVAGVGAAAESLVV